MIQILVWAILALLGIIVCGVGITAILVPEQLIGATLPLSFWVGVIWLALSGTVLSQMGIGTSQGWILILIASLILLYTAYKNGRIQIKFSKLGCLVGVLSIIALLIHLYPYLVKAQFPTTISMGNLDPISYSTVADFLQKNTVRDGATYIPYSPYLWSVGDLLHSSYRWGTPMVLSLISAAYGARAYQLFGILITLFFVMSYPMLWTLLKRLRPESGWLEAIILFLIYMINSTLMYTLYNVFFAQFAWGGILILSVYLSTTQNTNWLKALVVAGTALIYPEGIMFVVLPMLLLGHWGGLLIAAMMAPYPLFTSIRQLISVMVNSSQVTWIGWEHIRFPNMLEILGLYNLNYSRPLQLFLLFIPVVVLFYLIFWGLIKTLNRRVLGVYMGIFVLSYIATRMSGNWFTYFRAITYSSFLFILLFLIGLGKMLDSINKIKVSIAAVVVIGVLTIRSATRTAQQMYYHHQTVDRELVSLSQVPNIKVPTATADIFLGEYSLWIRLWREYMLMGKPIITRQNWTTDTDKLTVIDQLLVEKEKLNELSEKVNLKTKVWENRYYELYSVDLKAADIQL